MGNKLKWRFAAIQADLGLSRDEVAQRLGVSVSAVSRYRSGMPRIDEATLLNICAGLECTPGDLMQIEGTPHVL